MNFRFADPEVFILLLLIPALIAGYTYFKVPNLVIRYPAIRTFRGIPGAVSWKPVWIPRIFRFLAILFAIFAAARPQSGEHKEIIQSEGIDIVIGLDISGSMNALDFQPSNRLEVAKQVISDFINKRINDRIGLVLFGSESFTLCPLTLDYELLIEFLSQAQVGMVEEQTAIGKAISNAVNRLRIEDQQREEPIDSDKSSRTGSQIVILVTDGVNTVKSKIDPLTAAKAAKALGIKIYTIGVGTNGLAPFPHPRFPGRVVQAPVELDEDTLREIARITDGQYFSAKNSNTLQEVFNVIDKLEKVKVESFKYTRYTELFMIPLLLSLMVIVIETILRHSIYRRYP